MILLSITILIYISSLEFLWVPIMIFSSGYQLIYYAFQSYCALLCHNYSRLFYYTFNISSLLFRLIFYPSVILRSIRLNISSDKLRSFRLIFSMLYDCCTTRFELFKSHNGMAVHLGWHLDNFYIKLAGL